jgi:archaellum component FlaC
MANEKSEGNWNRAKDILTILVIPLAVWMGSQEVRMAKLEYVVATQEEIRTDLHDLEIKVAAMQGPIQTNTTDVEEIEARLEHLRVVVEQISKSIQEMH